jgi:multiple sugar transport system substrate-binding protein
VTRKWLVAAVAAAALAAGWWAWRAARPRAGGGRQRVELVWSVKSGPDIRPVYERAIARFEKKYPHISVKLLEIPGTVYYQKVLVMIASRNAPDVMWMGQSFGEYAEKGAFLDVTDRVRRDVNTNEFHQQALSWYRSGGRCYGIPHAVDMNFMAYNRDLFDKAGVPCPTDDWTLEQFLDMARKLTVDRDGDGRPEQFGFHGRLPPELFGGRALAADGSRALCNSPEMVSWLNFQIDCRDRWKVSPSVAEVQGSFLDSFAMFSQGRVAMMVAYTGSVPFLRRRCANVDWDIVCHPGLGGRQAHWASSIGMLAAADTRHPDEAWLLCKELFGDEYQREISRWAMPSNLRLARDVIANNRERPRNLGAFLEASKSLYPAPRIAHLSEYLQHFNQGVEKALAQPPLATPEEAMAQAEQAIDRAMAKRARQRRRR